MLFVWSIVHYREAVYRKLCSTPGLQLTICAGTNSSTFYTGGSIALADNLAGIDHRVIRSVRLKGPFLRGWEWQGEAVRLAWREKVDAMICFGPVSLSNWLVRLVCRLRGIPLLEWSIGVKKPEKGIRWAYRKFYMACANALMLYGRWSAEYCISRGFSRDRVFVIHNSLDHGRQVELRNSISDEEIEQVRAHYGVTDSQERLIFHSGRLETRKRIELLIDAVQQVRDRGRRVTLVLVGDGPEEERFKEHARRGGLADVVHFIGACYDEEALGRLFCASDLCVVPGSIGLLAMHSLVYGTPVLCSEGNDEHGPEVEAVIEGETGGFFRLGDVDHLTDRLEELLYENPCKPRMSEACRRIIDTEWTPAYQQEKIVEAINAVLPSDRRIPTP